MSPRYCSHYRRFGEGIGDPFQGPLDIIGSHRLAVVKLRVLAQVEGVYATVAADFPTLGQVGHNVQVTIDRDQSTENLHDNPG